MIALRLAALTLLLGLTTSRIALLLHELVGHGLVAMACGGEVSSYELFWFAGGRLTWRIDGPPGLATTLVTSLGGIALQLVLGALLLVIARRWRRGTMAALAVRAAAGAIIVHAGVYLAGGAFHRYGDGQAVGVALGAWRVPFSLVTGALTVLAAFWLARAVAGQLRAWLPGAGRARVLGYVLAVAVGGAAHAGLARAELEVRRDATYARIMEPENRRVVRRALRAYAEETRAARGAGPTEAELRAREETLTEEHRELPFAPLLIAAVAIACGLGAWRARGPWAVRLLRWRDLRAPAVVCALAIVAVAIAGSLG